MRWSPRSIRQPNDLSNGGEALLGAPTAFAGGERSGGGFSEPGTQLQSTSMLFSGSPSAPQGSDSPPNPGTPSLHSQRPSELPLEVDLEAKSASEGHWEAEARFNAEKSAKLPQPSNSDGVGEDRSHSPLQDPASEMLPEVDRKSAQAAGSGWDLTGRVDLSPSSDAAIMLRVAAGDESGFNYLVEKYHRPIIHFLMRMVRNQAIAEELAQEVFLRVYRSRESYRAEAKFSTWLYRIATNLAVNQARDSRHERAAKNVYLDAEDEETGSIPEVADDEPTVEERLLREERMKAIRTHVMALPERQRMAILMHKYQGMDYRQIGEVLKLSESATKSLLFRAYQTLREKLKDFV
jgi:RNA polymerase sigma-70 factor (ECF subfamily)